MSNAVQDILQQIHKLAEEDRLALEQELARADEEEWNRATMEARQLARQRGIDQARIDQAVGQVRQR